MANINSVVPYNKPTLEQLADSVGITQFPAETEWYQTIGGLLIQGGTVEVAGPGFIELPFNAAFPTQVLGVFLQAIADPVGHLHVEAVDLDSFEIHNAGATRSVYWVAIGV